MVIKYPCSICCKHVAANHKAIQCDECNKWSHIKCNYITSTEYYRKIGTEETWICVSCIPSVFPFSQLGQERLKLLNQAKDNGPSDDFFVNMDHAISDMQNFYNNIKGLDIDTGDNEFNINCKYYTPSELNDLNYQHVSLSIAHLNISSLSFHLDNLKNLINSLDNRFDVIGISESRLRDQNDHLNVDLDNYRIVHCPTDSNKGGSLLYISNQLDFVERPDLQIYQAKDLESVFVEVKGIKKNYIVGSIYRHPNMSIKDFNENFLSELMIRLGREKKEVLLMGDFNVDLMNYEQNEETNNFIEILSNNSFLPNITKPTRITSHSKTLIDNIFSNSPEQLLFSGNLTAPISDHLIQCSFFRSKAKQDNPNLKARRDFRNFDETKFLLEYDKIDWEDTLKTNLDNINDSMEAFLKTLNDLTNKHAPFKKPSKNEMKRKHSPWITNGILHSLKKRDKLYKEFIANHDPIQKASLQNEYKIYRNTLVTLCRLSKVSHYQKYFAEQKKNLKKVWSGIKSLISNKNKKSGLPNTFKIKNLYTSDPKNIANAFNSFYGTIAEKTKSRIPNTHMTFSDYLDSPSDRSIFISPTDENEVLKLIMELNDKKACGPGSIHVKILKLIAPSISFHLANLFNIAIRNGVFPTSLKDALICPVFKKGEENIISNYRPISLLSNIGKLLEKIIYNRFKSFLDSNNVLFKNQFGFRTAHSTNHALIQITEEIKKHIDKGDIACGVFIDLQKAFDTVEHSILLKKLNYYGIRGIANDLIKSYLSSRYQYVSVHDSSSERTITKHGVPQGSVLGPLLFLLYINDLHKAISHSSVFHFADDTSLLYSNKSLKKLNKHVNHDLSLLCHWLRANKISLNADKTELILFRSRKKVIPKSLNFKINGQRILPASSAKYLGIILDEHLTFEDHIKILLPKLSRAIGILARVRHYVPYPTLKNIYHSLFQSHLIYGLQVWAHGKSELVNKVQILQNKAQRVIHFKNHRHSATPLYKYSGTLKMLDFARISNCLFVHDHLLKKLPEAFNDYFTLFNEIHSYDTRGKASKLNANSFNTTRYGLCSVSSKCVSDWNNLQKELQTKFVSFSRNELKTLLFKYFLNSYA